MCPPGLYRSTGSGTGRTCLPCPPGVFGAAPGLASPQCSGPCPVGYWCPEVSVNGTANPCPQGTYGELEGQGSAAACLPCRAGAFSQPGAAACTPCPLGTASAGDGAPCAPCAPGSYSSTPGASACAKCPRFTSSPLLGLKSPAQCQVCGPWTLVASNRSSCIPCPQGVYCDGDATFACALPEGRCGAGACALPYDGRVCATCARGYFATNTRGLANNAKECKPCDSFSLPQSPLVIAASVVWFIALVLLVAKDSFPCLRWVRWLHVHLEAVIPTVPFITLMMHYSRLSVLQNVISLPLPNVLRAWLLNPVTGISFNAESVHPECLGVVPWQWSTATTWGAVVFISLGLTGAAGVLQLFFTFLRPALPSHWPLHIKWRILGAQLYKLNTGTSLRLGEPEKLSEQQRKPYAVDAAEKHDVDAAEKRTWQVHHDDKFADVHEVAVVAKVSNWAWRTWSFFLQQITLTSLKMLIPGPSIGGTTYLAYDITVPFFKGSHVFYFIASLLLVTHAGMQAAFYGLPRVSCARRFGKREKGRGAPSPSSGRGGSVLGSFTGGSSRGEDSSADNALCTLKHIGKLGVWLFSRFVWEEEDSALEICRKALLLPTLWDLFQVLSGVGNGPELWKEIIKKQRSVKVNSILESIASSSPFAVSSRQLQLHHLHPGLQQLTKQVTSRSRVSGQVGNLSKMQNAITFVCALAVLFGPTASQQASILVFCIAGLSSILDFSLGCMSGGTFLGRFDISLMSEQETECQTPQVAEIYQSELETGHQTPQPAGVDATGSARAKCAHVKWGLIFSFVHAVEVLTVSIALICAFSGSLVSSDALGWVLLIINGVFFLAVFLWGFSNFLFEAHVSSVRCCHRCVFKANCCSHDNLHRADRAALAACLCYNACIPFLLCGCATLRRRRACLCCWRGRPGGDSGTRVNFTSPLASASDLNQEVVDEDIVFDEFASKAWADTLKDVTGSSKSA